MLVDTAGRLHTKGNLMAELEKMGAWPGARCPARRTRRCSSSTPPSGRTALTQGREFAKAAGVTGLVLTKLDGTAKGGIAVAVVRELGVPDPLRRRRARAWRTSLPFDAAALSPTALIGS